eukprot:EG_transcript_10408
MLGGSPNSGKEVGSRTKWPLLKASRRKGGLLSKTQRTAAELNRIQRRLELRKVHHVTFAVYDERQSRNATSQVKLGLAQHHGVTHTATPLRQHVNNQKFRIVTCCERTSLIGGTRCGETGKTDGQPWSGEICEI